MLTNMLGRRAGGRKGEGRGGKGERKVTNNIYTALNGATRHLGSFHLGGRQARIPEPRRRLLMIDGHFI